MPPHKSSVAMETVFTVTTAAGTLYVEITTVYNVGKYVSKQNNIELLAS